jgi:hypothetical protein
MTEVYENQEEVKNNSTEQCLLAKLIVAQMVKIFLAVYGMMGSMMNSDCPHLSPYFRHIHFNIISSSAFRSSKFHYRLVFDHTSISISHFPHELHVLPI